MSRPKPTALIILDGWGIRDNPEQNGIAIANPTNFHSYWNRYPHTQIEASGPAVGLPQGIMGNSEVGHMNLGAGRVVFTGLSQIYQAIEDGSFFQNKNLLKAIQNAQDKKSSLHIMGLLSDGAVHSHQDHLYALLKLAKTHGIDRVWVHAFLDGRDTNPQSGLGYLKQLEAQFKKIGAGQLASVAGRFYAMDRDQRWERVAQAYKALTGQAEIQNQSASDYIAEAYQKNLSDEFIEPCTIIDSSGNPLGAVQNDDSIIFFNFRADRAREITYALTDLNFSHFQRHSAPQLGCFVCMAAYDQKLNLPVAFQSNLPKQTIGEIVSNAGLSQLRVAETEKYAHVTFFFSGGQEQSFPGEERLLIPSPREVTTYDQKPEMAAREITAQVIPFIEQAKYDFIVLNFANPDMVGHTAIPSAIPKAIQVVDECLNQIISKILQKQGAALVTADHGNAEQMVDAQGKPHTAHTTNPVPLLLISEAHRNLTLRQDSGRLCDVAPTLLELLELPQPKEMTGTSLIAS